MTKNIGIYLYDLRHPHVGLSEFDDNIARRIAERAKVWKEQYDIRFTFIVPQYLQGHYGPGRLCRAHPCQGFLAEPCAGIDILSAFRPVAPHPATTRTETSPCAPCLCSPFTTSTSSTTDSGQPTYGARSPASTACSASPPICRISHSLRNRISIIIFRSLNPNVLSAMVSRVTTPCQHINPAVNCQRSTCWSLRLGQKEKRRRDSGNDVVSARQATRCGRQWKG